MTPQSLIFDLDGTLADTMPLHWRAWQILLKKYGLTLPMDRFYALGGVPSRDILKMLGQEQGVAVDHIQAAKEKEAAYLALLSEVKPIEPILAIAAEHRGKIPLAVATGGTRHAVENVLRHLGIRDWFDAVVTCEDVANQKPAPDIFLEAARRVGVAPQCCRAYEDTDIGLQAIRDAGMEGVDVREFLARLKS